MAKSIQREAKLIERMAKSIRREAKLIERRTKSIRREVKLIERRTKSIRRKAKFIERRIKSILIVIKTYCISKHKKNSRSLSRVLIQYIIDNIKSIRKCKPNYGRRRHHLFCLLRANTYHREALETPLADAYKAYPIHQP